MNITKKELKKMLFKAFKEGQETPDATDGIIKSWIELEYEINTI